MPSYTYYIIWVRCDQIWLCFKGLVVEFSRKSLKKYLTTFEAILKNCAYYVKTTVPTFWKIEHLFIPGIWSHCGCAFNDCKWLLELKNVDLAKMI